MTTILGVILPGVWLLASGCVATRDWVQETRRQDTARIDEQGRRLDTVEVSVREGAQRFDALGLRVNEVGETAKDARARADAVDSRLTRLWDRRNARSLSDSMAVQFGFNRADLDDAAETALVALVRELRQQPKLVVELEGYADARGPREYNIQLSQRRVETVRRYLVQSGIEVSRIHSIGLGSLNDPKAPDAAKRRVTVKVMVLAD
jgi:outer membrane protein OmpA-like peptidoglycan-associated protein